MILPIKILHLFFFFSSSLLFFFAFAISTSLIDDDGLMNVCCFHHENRVMDAFELACSSGGGTYAYSLKLTFNAIRHSR